MKTNNNILDEIYQLESRLNKYHGTDAGISFDGLDDSNFDLNRYIQINFTRGRKEALQVDYEKINKSLTDYHDIQKNTCEEIVFSIDQNFEKYIGISTKFEGLKDRLTQTQEHFHHFNQTIEEYFTANTQDLNKLKEVLSTYEQVSKYEIAYKTIEDILLLIEECEQLKITQEQGENPFLFEGLKKASFLINLAETKYKGVSNRQSITADLEAKFEINNNIRKTKDDLVNVIEGHFRSILQELRDGTIDLDNKKVIKKIKACLECFSNLKTSESVQRCLEEIIVNPALSNLVEKMNEAKSQPAVSPHGSRELLRQTSWDSKASAIRTLYQNILQVIETGPLAELKKLGALINTSSIEGCNIILIAWKSVFNLLTSKTFAFIFSVGISDTFNNNYKESIHFLNSLANLFETPEEKSEFWSHETTRRFLAKWSTSTSTYYQLRFAEVVRDFGKYLSEDNLKLYVSEKRSISPLKETKTIKDFFERCFSTRVFNLHLSAKFLKLAYQLTVMYCVSLEDFYGRYYQEDQDFTENKTNLLKNIINELYLVASYCRDELIATVDEAFNQDIIAMNYENEAQIPHEKNQAYVEFFNKRLSYTILIFETEVAKYLINRCEANLEFVNGIPKKFRMSTTTKGKPTEPSNFLDNIFLPLGQFFQNYNFQDIPRKNIEKIVVNSVYQEYVIRTKKLLEGAQKEEETLSRYRNANLTNQVSDFEKIKTQFSLDNQQIALIVSRTVGVQLENYSESLFV